MADLNINSESWCRQAYLNYHTKGNTMGLTPADMSAITQTWKLKLTSWQDLVKSTSEDKNEYEFDDSAYADYKADGEQAAKDTTGYSGKKQWGETAINGAATAVGLGVGLLGTGSIGKFAMTSFGSTGKISSRINNVRNTQGQNNLSWSIAAPLALATAIKALAKPANQDAKRACDALQASMDSSSDLLKDEQKHMVAANAEAQVLADDANKFNEESNETLEKIYADYMDLLTDLLDIQERMEAGEFVSDSEKEWYNENIGLLAEMGEEVAELSEDTTDEVADLYDEIGTKQESFDLAAQSMGEVQGLTDFAAGFDKATKNLCIVESVMQGLNGASGGVAAAKAGAAAAASIGFNPWAWACVAMGTTAAGLSVKTVKTQIEYSKDIQREIDKRKSTQATNAETMSVYDEQLDYYAGTMEGVEDLELLVPEDVVPAEEAGVAASTEDMQGTQPTATTTTAQGGTQTPGATTTPGAQTTAGSTPAQGGTQTPGATTTPGAQTTAGSTPTQGAPTTRGTQQPGTPGIPGATTTPPAEDNTPSTDGKDDDIKKPKTKGDEKQ